MILYSIVRKTLIAALLFAACLAEAQVNELWNRRLDGSANLHDAGNKVVVDAIGNVYVCGSVNSGGNSDYLTMKQRPNGDTRRSI
jgi:hypothetical protein